MRYPMVAYHADSMQVGLGLGWGLNVWRVRGGRGAASWYGQRFGIPASSAALLRALASACHLCMRRCSGPPLQAQAHEPIPPIPPTPTPSARSWRLRHRRRVRLRLACQRPTPPTPSAPPPHMVAWWGRLWRGTRLLCMTWTQVGWWDGCVLNRVHLGGLVRAVCAAAWRLPGLFRYQLARCLRNGGSVAIGATLPGWADVAG